MNHMIRQQYVHVEVNGTESDGLALQRRLPDLCHHWLTPAIEQVLERCAPPDGHLYIERLEIDIGTLTLGRLEQVLPELVALALERAIREQAPAEGASPAALGDAPVQHKTARQSIDEAFIYFLETGSLPWSFRLPEGNNLEQAILQAWREVSTSGNTSRAVNDAVLQVLESATVRQRLFWQFSPAFLETLLALLSPEAKSVLERHWPGRTPITPAETNRLERTGPIRPTDLGGLPLSSPISEETPINISEYPAAGEIRAALAAGEIREHPEAREGIYIENAGLVLLHPFLPQFFRALDIAAEDALVQPERALCLLHFLTTGQSMAPEYALILPKILCNIPLLAPVETSLGLTDAETEEAVALLEAVIHHWDVLRNTSPDGLRGTFLLRPGKVSRRDDGDWLLQVESNSVDILLNQLPWGISMIKLPWMDMMLWVEWG